MTTELTTSVSYLQGDQLNAFTQKVEGVQRKLKDAWRDTLNAMQDLEKIRWEGEWLDDPVWKEWDVAAQRHGQNRAERSWFAWLGRRGGFNWNDRALDNQQVYSRLLATWVLTVAVENYNGEVMLAASKSAAPESGASGRSLLPAPTAVDQVTPFLSKIVRTEALPEAWLSHESAQEACRVDRNAHPYKAPAEQTDLVAAWDLCVKNNLDPKTGTLRYQTSSTGLSLPVPPSSKASLFILAKQQSMFSRPKKEYIETVAAESPAERDARLKAEAERRERSAKVWKDIDTESEARKRFNDQQLAYIEQQRKREEEVAPIRNNAFKYNELLVSVSRSIGNLRRFVEEIDSIHGTKFFAELRAIDLGLVSVADDVPRLQEAGTELVELCKLIASNSQPSGIKFSKTINEDGSDVADLEVI